jgi:acyl carrier protein
VIAPTFEEFATVIQRVFGQSSLEINPETRSTDVPGWDSLSHVMLILELQNEFGASIQPDETTELPSVGALYGFLTERLS